MFHNAQALLDRQTGPYFYLLEMEDAATAKISRAQLWHWTHLPNAYFADGRRVDLKLFHQFVPEESAKIEA
jgi:malate synthase